MRKALTANSVLYFILYSISLSVSWFEYGLAFPNTEGINLVWLFPIVYLLLFLVSLRFLFVKVSNASYLTVGIGTIVFISALWGISALFRTEQEPVGIRHAVYPAVLFLISLIILAIYLYVYVKNKKGQK